MDNKFGSKKIVGIVISIVAIAIVIIASIYYVITDGIVNQVYDFMTSLSTSAQEIGVLKTIMRTIGLNTDAVTMMSVYVIDDETVKNLKDTLEVQVDTETQGLTEVRLRKILLANKVSSSLSNTLVAVPVTEEEIINNAKEKNETIGSIADFKNNCKEVKNSKDVWPLEGTNNNYDLYYDSDIFYYFYDENKIIGDNEQWYLGAMGAIQLQTMGEEEGVENALGEYSPAEFDRLKTNYENDPSEENKAKLKGGYKQIDAENIELYTVSTTKNKIIYTSRQGEGENLQEKINEEKELETEIVVGTQQVSLVNDIDTTAYAIPIELMIDFLNITGSGEFLEEFIDYSLDKTKVKINAYCTENVETTYSKKEYNIKEDFIVEIYDFVNIQDNENDNFIAYKDLVFNRKYEGRNIGKITDIENYDQINYNNMTENGRVYSVDYICKYLKTAYEPGSDYVFKPILVKETSIEEDTAESWEMFTSEVSTWYGTSMCPRPSIKVEYDVPEGEATEEGYNAFTEDSLRNVINTINEKKIEKKYIYDRYYDELSFDEKADESVVKVEGDDANDIYDNRLTIESNSDGTNIDCEGLNVKTLGKIGMEDKGEENDNLGAGSASHYIYANYTKSNIKQFEGQTKKKIESLDTSNIGASSVTTENQMMNFLELLKNETGEIPEFIGSEGGFNREGKLVMYGDIYSGQIGAGDLLLDNGAQMLFELLESTETTQSLVPVFKYLAFLYTGRDYGVTDASQLSGLFETTGYGTFGIIVKTDEPNALEKLSKEKLEDTIKAAYSGQKQRNLLSALDGIYKGQEDNKVNGLFTIAVSIVESSGGTSWDLINSSSYNMFSISGTNNGRFVTDRNGRKWKAYSSFEEASYDFTNLIANSNYYFKSGKTTITAIAPTYCNEEWGVAVTREVNRLCGIAGIQVPSSGSLSSPAGTSVVAIAQDTFNTLKRQGKMSYNQSSGHTIEWPYKNNTIDCSSFVDIVMLRLGYNEFSGSQKNSNWWYNDSELNTLANRYGWQIFYIQGANDINKLQPGDIIAFNGYATGNYANGSSGSKNHIQIVDHVSGNKVIAWDCGYYPVEQELGPDTRNNVYFWGYHTSTKGTKVIRVTNKTGLGGTNWDNAGLVSGSGATAVMEAQKWIGKNGSYMCSTVFPTVGWNYAGEWCATFVSYCYKKAGITALELKNYSYVPNIASKARNQGKWYLRESGYRPKTGDLIIYDFPRAGLYNHVGLVQSCDGSKVYTIEGNVGTGGSWRARIVDRRTYNLNSSYIEGYYSL